MVREVRFSWDDSRTLPVELSSKGWDCDDVDEVQHEERRRPIRRGSARKEPSSKSHPSKS